MVLTTLHTVSYFSPVVQAWGWFPTESHKIDLWDQFFFVCCWILEWIFAFLWNIEKFTTLGLAEIFKWNKQQEDSF